MKELNFTSDKRDELRLNPKNELESSTLVRSLLDDCDTLECALEDRKEETDSLRAFLETHREKQNGFSYSRETLVNQTKRLVNEYENSVAMHVNGMVKFRNDTVISLRALSLIVDTIYSAGTHSEKNARLRGLAELLEGTIGRLEREEFSYNYRHHTDWRNVWRSDFPAQGYMERIRELQSQLASTERQLAEVKGEVAPNGTSDGDTSDPFANE